MTNQKGVVTMDAIIFFILAFLIFVGMTVWFLRSEQSKASQALIKSEESQLVFESIDRTVQELKKELTQMNAKYQMAIEAMVKVEGNSEKLKGKIEWLEMKANNHKPLPSKIILAQEKPIQFQVVYRESRGKQKPKPKLTENEAKQAIVKKIQYQMNELNQ